MTVRTTALLLLGALASLNLAIWTAKELLG